MDQEKVVYALNKSDLISPEEILQKADYLGLADNKKWVPVSAVTKENITKLMELVNRMISERKPPVKEIPKRPDLKKFDD